jgi:hypothetical protein
VRFGGEIDHGIDVGYEVVHYIVVADISMVEYKTRIFFQVGEVLTITGIRQGVQHDDSVGRVFFQHVADEVASYKPGSSGN